MNNDEINNILRVMLAKIVDMSRKINTISKKVDGFADVIHDALETTDDHITIRFNEIEKVLNELLRLEE